MTPHEYTQVIQHLTVAMELTVIVTRTRWPLREGPRGSGLSPRMYPLSHLLSTIAEELLAQAEVNGYEWGIHQAEDSTRGMAKYVDESQDGTLDQYLRVSASIGSILLRHKLTYPNSQ